jgi:hypothetical protein
VFSSHAEEKTGPSNPLETSTPARSLPADRQGRQGGVGRVSKILRRKMLLRGRGGLPGFLGKDFFQLLKRIIFVQ